MESIDEINTNIAITKKEIADIKIKIDDLGLFLLTVLFKNQKFH